MKTIILILFLIAVNIDLYSQGGVNVKYIHVDSIDSKYIGQKVKIDFKGNWIKDKQIQKIRIPDAVNILLKDNQIELIEVKGAGADYWYFEYEYLKSYNFRPGLVLKVEDIELQKISSDSMVFEMMLLLNEDDSESSKPVSSETVKVAILKSKIDGILIKK